METAQGSQILSISKRGRQLQELPSVDKDEFNAPPQRGLNLRPLLRTVQRKALLIIVIAGVVAVGAWVKSKSAPPTYGGDFRLLVEPVTNEARAADPSTLSRAGGAVPGQDAFQLDYATQLEILQSPKILSEIVAQVRSKYPEFSYDELKNGLVVQRYSGADPQAAEPTKMIEVRYQGGDPKQVQEVLEVTANRYLKYSLDERRTRIGEGVKFIEDQLPPLQKRVDTLESQRQKLQQQYKLNDPQAQGNELFEQLREVDTQLSQAQRELDEQRTLYTNLQRQLDLTPTEAVAASALSEDPNYRELQAKIQEIDNQIAVESARFLPDSPTIQSLRAKRQGLLALQNQETQRILGQSIEGTTNNPQVLAFQNSVRLGLIQKLVETTNQIQMLEVRNQALAQTRASFDRQAQQFPAIAREYTDIQQQLEVANGTLKQLLSQRETLRVEAAQKQLPWELVSNPQLPRDPAGNPIPAPSKAKNLQMMGVVLGLLLGVGAAVLIEKFRNIFYTTEELKDAIPLPLLGEIPLYKGAKQLPNSTAFTGSIEETSGGNESASQFLKAFDSLYASIRFLFSDRPIRSLAVCSAAPGDGKSTVALHLAQTAAAMGQRVLLVDANLRLPQLHTRLDLPNHKGLSDLLAQKVAPNDFISASPLADNLFVLTSGQPLPNSTKLLGSAQMQYLMEEFQATFDLVIYDTSHLLDRMDANFLAAHTDGILMVVGVRKTNRSVVMQVLEQLNTFRLPTLGVVANHVRKGTNIPYGTITATDLKLVGDELPVHHRV
jgi:capsular exopolysaccharide synthesis family protein